MMQLPTSPNLLPIDPKLNSEPYCSCIQDSEPNSTCTHVCDLRSGSSTSDEFYIDVSRFSDQVLILVERRAGRLLDSYLQSAQHSVFELKRSRGARAVDLLMLGLMLRKYGLVAQRTSIWVLSCARALVWARKHLPSLKPLIDRIRSGFAPILLSPNGGEQSNQVGTEINRLNRLLNWLDATGEFKEEAARLKIWRSYLSQLNSQDVMANLRVAVELFDVFEQEAEKLLGTYTFGVGPFLERQNSIHKRREDVILRSRSAAEYHLNMVAAEVMNCGLHEEFERTKKRVLLLPACMRGKKSGTCRANAQDLVMTCTGCDPECAVHRITRNLRALDVTVYIVPHTSGFSQWLKRWENTEVGITAAACLLHILPGGYEMRSRRIAAQCVPLDFPGCRQHWDPTGFPTALNDEQLVRIMSYSISREYGSNHLAHLD